MGILRSLLEMMTREYGDRRVLVVARQVIVNCTRYLIEQMDEHQILGIDREGDVPNCAVTSYRPSRNCDGEVALTLDLINFVAPLREAATPVTTALRRTRRRAAMCVSRVDQANRPAPT